MRVYSSQGIKDQSRLRRPLRALKCTLLLLLYYPFANHEEESHGMRSYNYYIIIICFCSCIGNLCLFCECSPWWWCRLLQLIISLGGMGCDEQWQYNHNNSNSFGIWKIIVQLPWTAGKISIRMGRGRKEGVVIVYIDAVPAGRLRFIETMATLKT